MNQMIKNPFLFRLYQQLSPLTATTTTKTDTSLSWLLMIQALIGKLILFVRIHFPVSLEYSEENESFAKLPQLFFSLNCRIGSEFPPFGSYRKLFQSFGIKMLIICVSGVDIFEAKSCIRIGM